MTWESSDPADIRSYYIDEFPEYREKLPNYIGPHTPTEYAIAFRDEHPVSGSGMPDRDFIRRSTWATDEDGSLQHKHFPLFSELLNFIQYPARYDPLQRIDADAQLVDPAVPGIDSDPVSAAVYYSATLHEGPWQLFIDIDAKDVAAERAADAYGEKATSLRDDDLRRKAGIVDEPPAGKHYAFQDIRQSLEYGFTVKGILETQFNASVVEVRYSGQGCHVVGLDADSAHQYDTKARTVIATLIEEEFGIPIDAEVTPDRSRVMRLPYSLHSEVSRIVTPISSPDFDFREEATPGFLDTTHRGGHGGGGDDTKSTESDGADPDADGSDAMTPDEADEALQESNSGGSDSSSTAHTKDNTTTNS